MSVRSLKRGIVRDPYADDNEEAKIPKEQGQLLREAEPFNSIDDVILELRSIEDYLSPVKGDEYRHILERLRKSPRFVNVNAITELRRLVDEIVPKACTSQFEEQLDKIVFGDGMATRKADCKADSYSEFENVGSSTSRETFQTEILQPTEQSVGMCEEEFLKVELKPNINNLRDGGNGFMAPYDCTEDPAEVSNQRCIKTVAQLSFNAALLREVRLFCNDEKTKAVVEEICDIIKQRTTFIENEQYEYILTNEQKFNRELLSKLLVCQHKFTPNMQNNVQELVDMVHFDSLDDCRFSCPFFRYLSDFELIKCILNDNDVSTAEQILFARQLWLMRLSFESTSGSLKLTLDDSCLGNDSVGIRNIAYRTFKYGMDMNKVDAVYMLFNIILNYYDVSQASISLIGDGFNNGTNYQVLESTFGAPPMDKSEKYQISQTTVDSAGAVDFLRWFCPSELNLFCDPGALDDLPSLFAGVGVIRCKRMNADRLLENCNSVMIHLDEGATWSEESVVRVLTAHRQSGESGCQRQITYQCHRNGIKSVKAWKEMFETWLRSCDDGGLEEGELGREVTLHDNHDTIKLMLH